MFRTPKELALRYARELDRRLESENYHSLSGVHEALCNLLLIELVLEQETLHIMREISERGGLTNLENWERNNG